MSSLTTEERLASLESNVEFIRRRLNEGASAPRHGGWRSIVGTFEGDPLYDEAMREGRTWRDGQVPAPEKEA